MQGQVVQRATILAGSTIDYLETSSLYAGSYLLEIRSNDSFITRKVELVR